MLWKTSAGSVLKHLLPVCWVRFGLRVSTSMSSVAGFSSAHDDLTQPKPLVGVVQMTATDDKEATFSQLSALVERAKNMGAKVVFLPECADYVATTRDQSIALAEPLNGNTVTRYKNLASRLKIWLSVGGFHEKPSDEHNNATSTVNKICNTQLMIDDDGEIQAVYRKVHLFDVDVPGGRPVRESDCTLPGQQLTPPIATPIGNVGMAICYDMRFPEMALTLSRQGAEVLIYPSAFFIPTGMAHWDVLLRSRAIETQCYVIAAAQIGAHNEKRSSYGSAMIVDPWGTVVARCHEQPDVCVAPVDLQLLQKRRRDLPVSQHRRPDLYNLISPCSSSKASLPDNINIPGNVDLSMTYQFGPHTLKGTSVFYVSALSLACVNRKPVVPGHSLVISQRKVPRLNDLTPGEVADLFVTAQRVAQVVQELHGASSCTIAVQDGLEAGQTVPHVHVHVLPRKENDFKKNDDVYEKLENHDKDSAAQWRTDDDMAKEAEVLRKYFT